MSVKIAIRFLQIVILLTVASSVHASETQSYTYDAKGRLVKVERTGGVNDGADTDYSHDDANNRTLVNTTGSPNGSASAKNLIVLPLNGFLVLPVPGPE